MEISLIEDWIGHVRGQNYSDIAQTVMIEEVIFFVSTDYLF